MKQLKIEIPEGFEIDSFDKETGEVKFKAVEKRCIMDRIKTFDDVCGHLKLGDCDRTAYINLVSIPYFPQHLIAYQKLILICKVLNEGWEPDWDDVDQVKYFPIFNMNKGFLHHYYRYRIGFSSESSRLCFKSMELSGYAGKQFEDIYKEFLL